MKKQHKRDISIKEVCNFTYELYLTKAEELKNGGEKQDPLYLAQICYISLLTKETRALMEFTRQIKPNFDGKNIEKLLSLKINSFSVKELNEMLNEAY